MQIETPRFPESNKNKTTTPDEILKAQEYKKGKRIDLGDGVVHTVHNYEEEVALRESVREH